MDKSHQDERFRLAVEISKLDPLKTDSRDWPKAGTYLYEYCDYAAWAEICRRAADMVTDPALKAMCHIEVANGLRRMAEDNKKLEALAELAIAHSLMDQVTPIHPRWRRLHELHIYHSSMLNHLVGNYADAARAYKDQIKYGIGNANFALYMAHFEALHDALFQREVELIKINFDLFEQAAIEFDQSLGSGPDDVRWRTNIACHRLLFRWIRRVLFDRLPSSEIDLELMRTIRSLPEELHPSFEDALAAVSLISLYNEQIWDAHLPLPEKMNLEGDQDWAAASLLVCIQFSLKLGKIEEAEEYKLHLSNLKGGHSIRALATRPLVLPPA